MTIVHIRVGTVNIIVAAVHIYVDIAHILCQYGRRQHSSPRRAGSEKRRFAMKNQEDLLMKNNSEAHKHFGFLSRMVLTCVMLGLVLFAGTSSSAAQSPPGARHISTSDAYTTTVDYVTRFYPLWFTYYQSKVDSLIGTSNLTVGSDRVTPLYHFVVAINYDTLYSGVYMNLGAEPLVVTFPPNPENAPFSLLVLDPYGNEITTEIPAQATGAFAFTGLNFSGTLPAGVTRVPMPINYPALYV